LRQSEILGLSWQDLDLDRGTLTVRHALARVKGLGLQNFAPKTKASAAVVPLTLKAVVALRAHRERAVAEGRLPAGYVFTTERGTPVSASNLLRRPFYPACPKAGIPTRTQPDGSSGLRFHDLRHACGSPLVQAGVRPKDVQTILRHTKLATTMDLYVTSYDADLRDAVGRLEAATK
jgi:integrase